MVNACFEDMISSLDIATLRKKYPNFAIRCGILLIRAEDEKILIVREKPRGDFIGNVCGPPKGATSSRDKTCIATACRELREETGISVSEACCAASRPYFVFFHKYFRELLVIFPVVMEHPPEPRIDTREISEYYWLSLTELKNCPVPMSSYTQKLIECLYNLCCVGTDDEVSLPDRM